MEMSASAARAAHGRAATRIRGPGMARHGATRTQCLLVVLLAAPAAAEEVRPEFPASKGGTYSFTFENDIFGGDDRNYTNGVRLDYASPRNDLLFWASCRAAEHGLEAQAASEILLAAARTAGLADREARATIASGLAR